jgi:hypothetical protein
MSKSHISHIRRNNHLTNGGLLAYQEKVLHTTVCSDSHIKCSRMDRFRTFTYVKKIYIETLHRIASDNTSPIGLRWHAFCIIKKCSGEREDD